MLCVYLASSSAGVYFSLVSGENGKVYCNLTSILYWSEHNLYSRLQTDHTAHTALHMLSLTPVATLCHSQYVAACVSFWLKQYDKG